MNIKVFVKKLRKRLKLLPVCGLIPQNHNSFLELSVGKLISGNRILLVAVIMLFIGVFTFVKEMQKGFRRYYIFIVSNTKCTARVDVLYKVMQATIYSQGVVVESKRKFTLSVR